MGSVDRFIASCNSWDDFWERAKLLSASEKGVAFERLTQLYLQTAPEYRTELQNVWMLRDVPSDIRQGLNLPSPDEGIDLVRPPGMENIGPSNVSFAVRGISRLLVVN